MRWPTASEQVDIDRALEQLRGSKSASEEELSKLQSQIGQRLKVLGERERALADYEARSGSQTLAS